MKVIFITASLSIVYIIRFGVPHKDSYNKEDDAFPSQYLIVPALLLGVVINQDHKSLFEIIWAFSIYLEAVAILPQLFLLQKQGEVENLTSHYVAALGAYRGLYLLNWIFRFFTEEDYLQRIVWLAGVVQVLARGTECHARPALAEPHRIRARVRVRPPTAHTPTLPPATACFLFVPADGAVLRLFLPLLPE